MKERLLLAGLLVPLAPGAEGPFVDLTFREACAQAKATERVVFIDFYTTWCGPCKKLDEVTWKDPKVIAWLEKNTVPLKVDAEKQVELARRFKVKAYPTLVFVKPDGKLQGQIVGYRDPADFLSEAMDVSAGVKHSERLREQLSEEGKNPMTAMSLARELVREGSSEEALELFLWCWDHGAEPPNESFVGVRGSFLINDLGRLAGTYPLAKDALLKRRDAAKELVLGQHPTHAGTRDFATLNKALKQSEQTLEVYDILLSRVQDEGPGQRAKALDPLSILFDGVAPQLMRAKRFGDVVAGYGDPGKWFEGKKRLYEQMVAFPSDESTLKYLRTNVVTKSKLLYRALLSTGEHDASAAELAAKVVAFAPSVKTWKTLMGAARSAKRKDIQTALRQQAIKALPEEDHGKLRKVRG